MNLETTSQNRETLLEQLRALPRVVWVLFAGLFIHRFGTFVIPFLTLFLKDTGYKTVEIAWVFAALAFGGIGAMILGGRLSDLIGRKNTMAVSLFGGAVSMILMWQADSFSSYLVAGFLVGITHGMYHPASNSLLIDVVPESLRVIAFAVVRWAVNLGFACGMATGGFLAEKSYSYLFVGDAITSACFAVIALVWLPHGVRTSNIKSRWSEALKDMLANRAFLAFFFANLFAVATFFQWGSSVARLITDLGYEKTVYGWLMAANGVAIALFEIPISQMAQRRSPSRVIAFGFLLCGVGIWLNGFALTWVGIAMAMAVFTLGEMISMPVSGAYVASLSPTLMRGRYSAAVGLTWNLGQAVAPGLGLLLYESYTESVWWGCLAIGCIAAALMHFTTPKAAAES